MFNLSLKFRRLARRYTVVIKHEPPDGGKPTVIGEDVKFNFPFKNSSAERVTEEIRAAVREGRLMKSETSGCLVKNRSTRCITRALLILQEPTLHLVLQAVVMAYQTTAITC